MIAATTVIGLLLLILIAYSTLVEPRCIRSTHLDIHIEGLVRRGLLQTAARLGKAQSHLLQRCTVPYRVAASKPHAKVAQRGPRPSGPVEAAAPPEPC